MEGVPSKAWKTELLPEYVDLTNNDFSLWDFWASEIGQHRARGKSLTEAVCIMF